MMHNAQMQRIKLYGVTLLCYRYEWYFKYAASLRDQTFTVLLLNGFKNPIDLH